MTSECSVLNMDEQRVTQRHVHVERRQANECEQLPKKTLANHKSIVLSSFCSLQDSDPSERFNGRVVEGSSELERY